MKKHLTKIYNIFKQIEALNGVEGWDQCKSFYYFYENNDLTRCWELLYGLFSENKQLDIKKFGVDLNITQLRKLAFGRSCIYEFDEVGMTPVLVATFERNGKHQVSGKVEIEETDITEEKTVEFVDGIKVDEDTNSDTSKTYKNWISYLNSNLEEVNQYNISLNLLMVKNNISFEFIKKYLIEVDKLTLQELMDLDYVEDRIETHKSYYEDVIIIEDTITGLFNIFETYFESTHWKHDEKIVAEGFESYELAAEFCKENNYNIQSNDEDELSFNFFETFQINGKTPETIENIDDAREFVKYLRYTCNLAFHPDDSFEDYVQNGTDLPLFTKKQISIYNKYMDDMFELDADGDSEFVKNGYEDVYDFCMKTIQFSDSPFIEKVLNFLNTPKNKKAKIFYLVFSKPQLLIDEVTENKIIETINNLGEDIFEGVRIEIDEDNNWKFYSTQIMDGNYYEDESTAIYNPEDNTFTDTEGEFAFRAELETGHDLFELKSFYLSNLHVNEFDYNAYLEDGKLSVGIKSTILPSKFPSVLNFEEVGENDFVAYMTFDLYESATEELRNFGLNVDWSDKDYSWTIKSDSGFEEVVKSDWKSTTPAELSQFFSEIKLDSQFDKNSPEYCGFINIDTMTDDHDRAVMLYIVNNKKKAEKYANEYGLTIESAQEGELIINELVTELKAEEILGYQEKIDWLNKFLENWNEAEEKDADLAPLIATFDKFCNINSLIGMSADELIAEMEDTNRLLFGINLNDTIYQVRLIRDESDEKYTLEFYKNLTSAMAEFIGDCEIVYDESTDSIESIDWSDYDKSNTGYAAVIDPNDELHENEDLYEAIQQIELRKAGN